MRYKLALYITATLVGFVVGELFFVPIVRWFEGCRDYPVTFVGPILPCDTRGGHIEPQRPPTVSPTQ